MSHRAWRAPLLLGAACLCAAVHAYATDAYDAAVANPQRSAADLKRDPLDHPGAILREDILPDLGMTIIELSAHLELSRQTLHMIMRERRAITADVAVRFGRAFGTTSAFWMNLQSNHDTWHAERSKAVPAIKRIVAGTKATKLRKAA